MALPPVQNVLCAVDLTVEGDEALRQADALAKRHGAALIAFHALPALAVTASTAFVALERKVLETLTARVLDVTGRGPHEFRVEVGSGTPHAAIVEAGERVHADLLVVGRPRPHVLGATAERVVRHAHCPVWVAHAFSAGGPVVAAFDFSTPSQAALSAAADFARRSATPLVVVHALSIDHVLPTGDEAWSVWSPRELDALRTDARARLNEVLAREGLEAEALVSDSSAAAAVLAVAEQKRAQLICVGTVGRTGLRRALLGSVAEAVVRQSHRPVLVTRAPA